MISTIFNFENIGKKLKSFAKWACWINIGIVWCSAPIALIALISDRYLAPYWWIPVIAAIVVPIIIWISSWLIYAFGELVDTTSDIRHYIQNGKQKSTSRAKIDSDRIDKIDELHSLGLITEEEYQQAIQNINDINETEDT